MSILFLREVGLLAVARVQLGSSEQVSQQDIFGVVSADRFWGERGEKRKIIGGSDRNEDGPSSLYS